MLKKEDVLQVLNHVFDPDYKDKSIVEMGLVDAGDIKIDDEKIEIIYGITAPLCPFSAAIGLMIKYAVEKKLNRPVFAKIKSGHFQEAVVNEILNDEEKYKN